MPIFPLKSSLYGLTQQMSPPPTPKEAFRLTRAKESESDTRLPTASHTPGPGGFYLSLRRTSMTAPLMGYRHSDLTQEKACQRRSRGSQAPPSLPAGSCLTHITRDIYAASSVPDLLQVFTLRMKESVKTQKAFLPAWRGARLPGTSLLHQHMTAYHIDVLICGQFSSTPCLGIGAVEKVFLNGLASQVMSVTVFDRQPGRHEPKQKL